MHDFWGGIKSYSFEQLLALFSAADAYQSAANKDQYANLVMQAFTTNASVGAVLNMIYLKAEPWDWFASSFKPSSAALFQKIAKIVVEALEMNDIVSVTADTLTLVLQPISSSFVRAGHDRDSNMLGLKSVNQTWFVLHAEWWTADDDKTMHNSTRVIRDRIARGAKKQDLDVEYLLMKDTSYDQDIIRHYRAKNVEDWKKVWRYDLAMVF
ncbi:MAG: hypothetical protein Q9191_005154 [Dirinaria sp. TL-2023a]